MEVASGTSRGRGSLCRWHVLFFLQAEDGIRELGRSRGLGDVYKRQGAKGWDPVGDTSGLAWAIASRNRALVAVGYHGALRAAELVKARAEDLEWLPERQRFILKIPSSKTSGVNADFVPLPATGKESCPVAALQDWFDYRGCLLYTSPSPRDRTRSRMPSSA